MEIGERIKKRREKLGMSQQELAELVGYDTRTAISKIENNANGMTQSKLVAVARALRTTPAYLMGWEEEAPTISIPGAFEIKTKRVPLLGSIACGEPLYAEEEWGEYVLTDEALNCDFALRATGDSMTGARINDGDVVFVRKQSTVNNGEIAVVLIGDEATLKRVQYYPDKKRLVLYPENPAYAPLVFVNEELEEVRILGKAVAFQSTL